MPTFATSDWISDFSTALGESADVLTASVSWVFGPLVLLVDGDDELGFQTAAIRVDLHDGASRSVRTIPARDVARAPFVLGGSVERWKSVFASKLSMVDAVLDSRLRLSGDLPTIARHRDLLDAIAAAGGSLDTSWPEPAAANA